MRPDGSLLAQDRTAQVEIVVPVRDEERGLEPSIRRLAAYLGARFPFRAVVTIADNGGTDRTWAVARALARELDGVRTVRLDQSGRGRTLRSVWSASDWTPRLSMPRISRYEVREAQGSP